MSYYKLLEVEHSATLDDIRAAYKDLVLQAHPDKGGSAQMFKRLQDAYEVLRDPVKRKDYDEKLKTLAAAKRFAKSSSYPSALPTVKNPVTFQLMNGDLYVFETAADKMKCRFRSGDVVTNKKEQSGCIIGAGSNGIYWRKDGDAFASLLFNPGGFGGDDNITMLFKADASGLGSTLGGTSSYSGCYSPRMTTGATNTSASGISTPTTPTRSSFAARTTQSRQTSSTDGGFTTPRAASNAASRRTQPLDGEEPTPSAAKAQASVRTNFSSRTVAPKNTSATNVSTPTPRSSSRNPTSVTTPRNTPSVATPRTTSSNVMGLKPTSTTTPVRTNRAPSSSATPRMSGGSVVSGDSSLSQAARSRHVDPMGSSSHSEVSVRSSQRASSVTSGRQSNTASNQQQLSPLAQQRRDVLRAARQTQIMNSLKSTQALEADKRNEINRDVDEHFKAVFAGIATWAKRPSSVHPRTCVPHSSALRCFGSVDKLSNLKPNEVAGGSRTATSRSSSVNSVATATRVHTSSSLTPNRTSRTLPSTTAANQRAPSSTRVGVTTHPTPKDQSRINSAAITSHAVPSSSKSSTVIGTPRRTASANPTNPQTPTRSIASSSLRQEQLSSNVRLTRTASGRSVMAKPELITIPKQQNENDQPVPEPASSLVSPRPAASSAVSSRYAILREARGALAGQFPTQQESTPTTAVTAEELPFPNKAYESPKRSSPPPAMHKSEVETAGSNRFDDTTDQKEDKQEDNEGDTFLTAEDISKYYPRVDGKLSAMVPLSKLPTDEGEQGLTSSQNVKDSYGSDPNAAEKVAQMPRAFTLRLPKPTDSSDVPNATPRGYRSVSLAALTKGSLSAAPAPTLTPRVA